MKELSRHSLSTTVWNKARFDCMALISERTAAKSLNVGEIDDIADIRTSLPQNAISESILIVRADENQAFRAEPRDLMAQAIREYYKAL